MAATNLGTRNDPSMNDMDNSLFDYDVDDVFLDVDTNMDVPAMQKAATTADRKETGAGLGIDEEIKVTQKRVPIPKLDENRLLSSAGLPKLRKIAKERLKFKGKGHEYSDVARLLNAYQLWLDDLYPRAKFADGLAIIEKLGHKKRMQTMRREWINEGKPQERLRSLGEGAEQPADQEKLGQDQSWEVELKERPRTPIDDDLYTATPRSPRNKGTTQGNSDTEEFVLGEMIKTVPEKCGSPAREENFDDDEEAMLSLDNVW